MVNNKWSHNECAKNHIFFPNHRNIKICVDISVFKSSKIRSEGLSVTEIESYNQASTNIINLKRQLFVFALEMILTKNTASHVRDYGHQMTVQGMCPKSLWYVNTDTSKFASMSQFKNMRYSSQYSESKSKLWNILFWKFI